MITFNIVKYVDGIETTNSITITEEDYKTILTQLVEEQENRLYNILGALLTD